MGRKLLILAFRGENNCLQINVRAIELNLTKDLYTIKAINGKKLITSELETCFKKLKMTQFWSQEWGPICIQEILFYSSFLYLNKIFNF